MRSLYAIAGDDRHPITGANGVVKYREPGVIKDDNYDLGLHEVVTREEPEGTPLYDALRRLICFDRKETTDWEGAKKYLRPTILVTHEDWDSGYSTYTITSQWQEVVVSAPELGWENRWGTMALLFEDLSGLNFSDSTPEHWVELYFKSYSDDHRDSNSMPPIVGRA